MPLITGYDLSPKHKASVLVEQGNRCAECGEILGVHKAHLWYEHMVATALCVSELLINLRGLRRYVGSFGVWSGLTPDNSALFVRDLSTDEIYALELELP